MNTIPTAIAAIVATLAARDPGATELLTTRGNVAAEASVKAAAGEHKFLGTDAAGRAALLTAWSFFESRWDACAKGDSGRSIGIMQVNRVWGGSEKLLLCNVEGGIAAGMQILDRLAEHCGTPRKALTAYATGRCVSTKTIDSMVEQRWAIAGLPKEALDKPVSK